jgi:hypothetical protein
MNEKKADLELFLGLLHSNTFCNIYLFVIYLTMLLKAQIIYSVIKLYD